MHRSIGVTLFLIASVLIPRQARAIDPITAAVVAIIGTASAAADLKERVEVWTGLVESDGSKLDRIIDKDLFAARNFMEQYKNTPKNKELLKLARTRFTDAAAVYVGRQDGTTMYKRGLALLGLKLCCDASNDQANAQMALVKIVDIGLLPESTSIKLPDWMERSMPVEAIQHKEFRELLLAQKKGEPDYVKYLAVWEAVMANLMKTSVYERNAVQELANKLLVGKDDMPKDEAAGFKLMQLVATQGAVIAQYNVGALYKDGKGVERNYSGAAYWYRKAAEKGHRRARSELGNLYLNGRGVPKNVIEGAAWIGLSSRKQNYEIKISGAKLTPNDKIKVQKRVSELFKKYGKTK